MSCQHLGKKVPQIHSITSPPLFCCPRVSNNECCTRSGNQEEFKWEFLFLSYFAGISFHATTHVAVLAPGNWWGGKWGKYPRQEQCRTALQHHAGVMSLLSGRGAAELSEVNPALGKLAICNILIVFFMHLSCSFFTVWNFRAYGCTHSKPAYRKPLGNWK